MREWWFVIAYACFFTIVVLAAIDSKEEDNARWAEQKLIQEQQRAAKIKDVKERCELADTEVTHYYTKYIYVCPDKEVFSYVERFNEK
jgi:hypothetical protein